MDWVVENRKMAWIVSESLFAESLQNVLAERSCFNQLDLISRIAQMVAASSEAYGLLFPTSECASMIGQRSTW